MPHRRSARLSNWQMWLLCLSLGLLWLSGAAWLLLHYYGQVQGEFGPETSPYEPWMLRLHGFVLIPALLGIGTLLLAHVPFGWKYRAQRVAGIALAGAMTVLILSGYLLYYLGDETLRPMVSLTHWALGLGGPVVFGWHYLNGRRLRR